ncbi:hypothetical protein ES705_34693 [subsurface metagenome]
MYGNKNPKGWELAKTNRDYPEAGGRIQTPVPRGEAAVSYHFRVADTRELEEIMPVYSEVNENRVGFDAKFDFIVGVWFEGAWVTKNQDLGIYKNQQIINVGTDYTFGIGSGLYMVFEQLFASYGEKAFSYSNSTTFSLMSLSYPISVFDNISAIFYFDWTSSSLYNFINWQKQFDNITLYVMGYWNPDNYEIPLQDDFQNLYGGIGIQIMFVYNH